MNKFIKVTSISLGSPVYINIQHIGHFYEYGGNTTIGVTTHNNGGFSVKESIEDIVKMINEVNN